jgi:hypothetical protein
MQMKARSAPVSNDRRPEVILDFTAEQGLLYVVLRNIGARSAYRVTVRFDHPFHGLGGTKCVSDLQLFRALQFLPPGKEFRQLVDPVADYFKRREPKRLTATLSYGDREGSRFQDVITHDLRIYRDLGYTRTLGPE